MKKGGCDSADEEGYDSSLDLFTVQRATPGGIQSPVQKLKIDVSEKAAQTETARKCDQLSVYFY